VSAGDLALQILISALDEASPVIASVAASLDTLAPSVAAVNSAMASADTSLAAVDASATTAAAAVDATNTALAATGTSAAAADASLGAVATSTDIASQATQSLATALPLADQATQALAGSTSSLAAAFGEDYAALNAAAGAAGPVVASMGNMTEATIAAQAGFGNMSGSMEAAMAGFGGVGVDATMASVGMNEEAAAATTAATETANAGEASRASGYQMMMYAAIISMVAGAFIGMGTEAQTNLAIVAGLTGTSAAMMGQYTSALEGMSTQFGVTMANMAQGLYYVVSAGFSGANALNVLSVATEAAVASGAQEEAVSHLLTGAMNAYGVSADQATHFSDVLMAAVTYGSQTFSDLTTSFGMAAATGAAFGVSLEQMAAAEATLTDRGLPAHRAIMDLDFMIRAVMGDASKTADAAQKLGLSFNETTFKAMDLYHRLQYLWQISGGNVTAFTKLVGGANGLVAALDILKGHGELYNKILNEIEHSSGRTAAAFQTAEKTMAAAGDHLKAVLSVLSYQFVTMISPTVIPIMHAITGALTALSKNAELAKVVFYVLAGVISGILMAALISLGGFFLAAIGPMGQFMIVTGALKGLLVAFAPQIIDFFQKNQWALAMLVIALGALSAVIAVFVAQSIPRLIISFLNLGAILANWVAGVLIGNVLVEGSFMETAAAIIASMIPVAVTVWAALWPILAIGAAIAALVVIFKVLYDRWQPFHNLVNASIAGLRNLWDWLVNKVGAGFSALGTWIHGTVIPALQVMWNWLVNKVGAAFSALGTFVNAVKPAIGAFFSWLGTIANIDRMGWVMIFSKIGEMLNAIKPTVGAFFSWLGTGARAAATVMGQIFSTLGTAANAVRPLLGFVGQEFSALGKTVQDVLKNLQSGPFAGLGKAFGDLGHALSGLGSAWQGLQQAMGPVQAEFSALWATIGTGAQKMKDALGPAFQAVRDAMKPVGDQLKLLGAALSGVGPSLGPLFSTIGKGARDIQAALGPAFKEVWDALVQAVKPLIDQFKQLWPQIQKVWAVMQAQFVPALKAIWNSLAPLLPVLKVAAGLIGGVLVVALGLAVSGLVAFVDILASVITGLVRIITGIVTMFAGLITALSGVVQFIVDLVTGHFDKLGADLGKIWDGIKTMALGLWTTIQGIWQASIGAILSGIGAFVNSVITFFKNLFNALVGHSIIPDLVNAIVNWFRTLASIVLGIVTGWVAQMIARVINLKNMVVSAVQSLASLAINFVQNMVATLINLWNSLIGRVAGIFNTIRSTILGILQGIASSAFSAGANIVGQIASGILSNIGSAIGGAMSAVGSFISSHLPASPAKVGPLKDLAKQGSKISEQISIGIISGIPHIEKAMTALVKPISTNGAFSLATSHSQAFTLSGTQPIIVQVQPVAANITMDGKKVGQSTLRYAGKEIRIQGAYKNA
jgi:TP901 family phage tail tape measure protein